MIAIQTKYYPATNTRPTRIKAWTNSGFVEWGYFELEDDYESYKLIAQKLIDKNLDCNLPIIGGYTGNGYTFVFVCSNNLQKA